MIRTAEASEKIFTSIWENEVPDDAFGKNFVGENDAQSSSKLN